MTRWWSPVAGCSRGRFFPFGDHSTPPSGSGSVFRNDARCVIGFYWRMHSRIRGRVYGPRRRRPPYPHQGALRIPVVDDEQYVRRIKLEHPKEGDDQERPHSMTGNSRASVRRRILLTEVGRGSKLFPSRCLRPHANNARSASRPEPQSPWGCSSQGASRLPLSSVKKKSEPCSQRASSIRLLLQSSRGRVQHLV